MGIYTEEWESADFISRKVTKAKKAWNGLERLFSSHFDVGSWIWGSRLCPKRLAWYRQVASLPRGASSSAHHLVSNEQDTQRIPKWWPIMTRLMQKWWWTLIIRLAPQDGRKLLDVEVVNHQGSKVWIHQGLCVPETRETQQQQKTTGQESTIVRPIGLSPALDSFGVPQQAARVIFKKEHGKQFRRRATSAVRTGYSRELKSGVVFREVMNNVHTILNWLGVWELVWFQLLQ